MLSECGVLVGKGGNNMTRNMDAIAWSTRIELLDENVEFLSIFTPMSW